MTLQDAIEIIEKIGAAFVGNLESHRNIQQALEIIKKAIEDKNAEN
tara:strand:- start:228 stop:365 length:138 start_codon:yes stop_codon:yes gene_type:complete